MNVEHNRKRNNSQEGEDEKKGFFFFDEDEEEKEQLPTNPASGLVEKPRLARPLMPPENRATLFDWGFKDDDNVLLTIRNPETGEWHQQPVMTNDTTLSMMTSRIDNLEEQCLTKEAENSDLGLENQRLRKENRELKRDPTRQKCITLERENGSLGLMNQRLRERTDDAEKQLLASVDENKVLRNQINTMR